MTTGIETKPSSLIIRPVSVHTTGVTAGPEVADDREFTNTGYLKSPEFDTVRVYRYPDTKSDSPFKDLINGTKILFTPSETPNLYKVKELESSIVGYVWKKNISTYNADSIASKPTTILFKPDTPMFLQSETGPVPVLNKKGQKTYIKNGTKVLIVKKAEGNTYEVRTSGIIKRTYTVEEQYLVATSKKTTTSGGAAAMPKRTQGAILSRDQIVINTIKADIGKLFKIDFSKHGMFKEPETGAAGIVGFKGPNWKKLGYPDNLDEIATHPWVRNPQTVSFRTQTSERLRLSTSDIIRQQQSFKVYHSSKVDGETPETNQKRIKVHPTWNSKYKRSI